MANTPIHKQSISSRVLMKTIHRSTNIDATEESDDTTAQYLDLKSR
uniref:Uncharacterized protein n=1 Tax=Arundo donax TaxID=35708 RepID=A0A0A9HN40_ARUDO